MRHLSLHVKTVENRKRRLAIELIQKVLDRNANGRLEAEERDSARLILLRPKLRRCGCREAGEAIRQAAFPVLLTVQIDSVGSGDARIPPNVARAASLFQKSGLLISGEAPIVAEDPLRTTILGNFEFDYRQKKIDISAVPWHKKIFREAHTKMEHDPDVWERVEGLILKEINLTSAQ
jgi:hypothetical protein